MLNTMLLFIKLLWFDNKGIVDWLAVKTLIKTKIPVFVHCSIDGDWKNQMIEILTAVTILLITLKMVIF